MPKEDGKKILSKEDVIIGLVSLGHYVERSGASWYEGEQRVVMVNGVPLVPYPSLKLLRLSDTFSWGSGMSAGTRQLALALLLYLSKEETAVNFCNDLAKEFLSVLPSSKGFMVAVEDVREWIRAKERGEMYKLYEVATIIEKEKTLGELATGISTPKEKKEKKENGMKRKPVKSKYPLKTMEAGESFFFNDARVYHIMSVLASQLRKKEKKLFTLRRITAKWAKEQGLDLPKGGYGVWRVA